MSKLNYHFSLIGHLNMSLLIPLVSFCDEYLLKIKEPITTEKTDK